MIRYLFTLLSALSFLLCITAGICWVRSYWVTDRWITDMTPEGSRTCLQSERGRIRFYERCFQDPQSKEVFSISFIGPIGIPHFVIVLLAAVLPIVWIIVSRRR